MTFDPNEPKPVKKAVPYGAGYPYYDLVQKAHNDLLSEGKIQYRETQEEVEQDKGLLTRRAAYYVSTQRNPSHGLLEKTSGNNSEGYSVDWILQQTDGDGWDVVTDDGHNALPLCGGAHGPDSSRIPSWRQATAELAQYDESAPVPTPPPTDDETQEKLDAILSILPQMESRIIQASDAGDKATLDRLNSIIDQAEATLKKIAVLLIARRPEEPPVEEDNPTALIIKILKSITVPQNAKKK